MEQITRLREQDGLVVIQNADPVQLATFIQDEHPQTIALILSQLEASQAAILMSALPSEGRSEVAARIAGLDHISPEVLDSIAGMIGERLKALGKPNRKPSGGLRVLAEILNNLEPERSEEILSAVAQDNMNLAESVRSMMFVFEDLLAVSKEGMQSLLARVDRKVLTMALKGTSEELKGHFTQCMSQRAAEMLREDMEALGPVRLRDVEAAQQQILAAVRQLQTEGALDVKGTEEYVV